MKSNQLAQGFLVILMAAVIVVVLDFAFGETVLRQSLVELAVLDSVEVLPPGIYKKDSLLEGEELWEDLFVRKEKIKPRTGNPLAHFMAALGKLNDDKKKVRIGYFGDSMIEGDLITQSLRHDLQAQFGGMGVGFVPITSPTYGFRKSIKHRFSGGWNYYNLFTPNPTGHGYGISGELFLPTPPSAEAPGKTWVKYWGTDLYPTTGKFETIKLFYGRQNKQTQASRYVILTTNLGKDTVYLDAEGLVNEVLLSDKPVEQIKLNFSIPADLPLYGMSFESESGILVDNFSSRGNSGMNLIDIPQPTLKTFEEHLQYDLIVLQFGLNVISKDRTNYKSYEKGMKKVIEHFKSCMPDVDILLVSVSDKGTKIKGVMQTDPSVPLLVEAQRRVAEEMNIGFLDLYQGMGGRNSIIKWVNDKPSLAVSDYTHPNRRGAVRLSNIVKDHLLKEYRKFTPGLKEKSLAGNP